MTIDLLTPRAPTCTAASGESKRQDWRMRVLSRLQAKKRSGHSSPEESQNLIARTLRNVRSLYSFLLSALRIRAAVVSIFGPRQSTKCWERQAAAQTRSATKSGSRPRRSNRREAFKNHSLVQAVLVGSDFTIRRRSEFSEKAGTENENETHCSG